MYLFVEVVAGPESILDGVLVVGGVEVEKVHTVGPQPLKGGFQLGPHALRLQRLPIPGVGLGGDADCQTNNEFKIRHLKVYCSKQNGGFSFISKHKPDIKTL